MAYTFFQFDITFQERIKDNDTATSERDQQGEQNQDDGEVLGQPLISRSHPAGAPVHRPLRDVRRPAIRALQLQGGRGEHGVLPPPESRDGRYGDPEHEVALSSKGYLSARNAGVALNINPQPSRKERRC